MLITDNTEGQSDGRERDTLQGMIAVGSEFMTFDDGESIVQRSGAFARYERVPDEAPTVTRYVLLHELSQVYTAEGVLLGDDEYRNLNAGTPMARRLRGFKAEMEGGQSKQFKPMEQLSGFSRIPRFNSTHYYAGGDPEAGPRRKYYDLVAQNYTAQGGKRRLFSLGDGRIALIRERFTNDDGRYFYGTRNGGSISYTKARGVRVSTVDLALIDASTGAAKQTLLSFDVRSGTGVEIPDRIINTNPRATLGMIDANYVYGVYAGAMWGRSLSGPDDAGSPPVGGDPADTYAIAPPAWVEKPGGGGAWLSLVAVYPAADDAYNSDTSGPYRLTCKRTLPNGVTATSKITIPAPADPRNYLAPFGMVLLRLTPTRLVLRMSVQAMQHGAGGAFDATANLRMYFWSDDSGATWTHNWTGAGFPVEHHYGGDLVLDDETVLAFSVDGSFAGQSISIYNVKATGTSLRASIPASVCSSGLQTPLYGSTYATPYMTVGFGGVVYVGAGDAKTKRIWIQFDPIWTHKESESFVIDYPGSRPMLVVSDDGGLTWQRRLLPTKWAHLAGFVVSTGPGTLAVPVLSQRASKDAAPAVTIYESRNGGDSWSPTAYRATLPSATWADGQIVYGAQIGIGASQRFEQDVKDAPIEYNRGELLPLLTLRDEEGKLVAGDPARPWITDFRKTRPNYG